MNTLLLLLGLALIQIPIGTAYAYDDVWTATPEIVSPGEPVIISGIVVHYKAGEPLYHNATLYKDGEFLRQLDLYSECCGETLVNGLMPYDLINWTFEMEETGEYTLDHRYGLPAPSPNGFNAVISWIVEADLTEIIPDPEPTEEITIQTISEPTYEPEPIEIITGEMRLEELILEELIVDPEPIPQINNWEQKYNDIVSMMSTTADKLGDAEKKLERAEKKLDQSQQSLKDLKKQMNNFNTAELETLQKQNKDLKEKIDNLNSLVMEQVKVIYKWVLNN